MFPISKYSNCNNCPLIQVNVVLVRKLHSHCEREIKMSLELFAWKNSNLINFNSILAIGYFSFHLQFYRHYHNHHNHQLPSSSLSLCCAVTLPLWLETQFYLHRTIMYFLCTIQHQHVVLYSI